MKTLLLVLILCLYSIQMSYSQEDDGIVALKIPVRNSLTFNRSNINPTFSFVREQNKYINITNKREWVQFEDAPLTYLAAYSGRFGENIGAGLSVFQQNYGVLSTFGGVLNFAYNARLDQDSNLTFGLNIGAYKSGLNTGNVVTNFDDPSIENVPKNFLVTVNPGINYGTGFFDFGVSLNNLVAYNFQSSMLLEENPEQGIQAHIMYTGYIGARGFFDESKFTTLVQSEFKTEETIISAVAMVTVPKGIWAQVGYNTVYGATGGLGLNITPEIAIEYNFEKALGDLTEFGPSHEITFAYRFKNTEYYDYSGGDEVSSFISGDSNKRKKRNILKAKENRNLVVKQKAKENADAQSKLLAEQKAKDAADAQSKLLAEQKAKDAADAQSKLLAEQKAKDAADAQSKLLAEQKAKDAADAQSKLLAEQKAKDAADAQSKLLAEQKAKDAADAQAKLLAEQKAKDAADAQSKLLAEQKAKDAADAQAKLLAEQKAKDAADAQAKLLAEQNAKDAADAQSKLLAEQKAKDAADAQAKLLAEQKAKDAADAQSKLLAEQKAKDAADAQAKLLAEQKAKDAAILNPTDKIGKDMLSITQETDDLKTTQDELLLRFNEIVEVKNQDLQDLKEEYELSQRGIAVKPKPFKSIIEENNALEAITSYLDDVVQLRNKEIEKLKKLQKENASSDITNLDEVNLYYRKTIERLEFEQKEIMSTISRLDVRLKDINISTEFERKRRIKLAAYDNEDKRYSEDRKTLQNIKKSYGSTTTPYTSNDFDSGEKQNNNIQILENIKNVESGYYLVIAVHSDVKKRDDFLIKVIQSGRKDVDFFYDVNSSKYYIYYDKFDNIQAANQSLKDKGSKPYNSNMSLIKIEN